MVEISLNDFVPKVYIDFVADFIENKYSEYVLKGGRGSIKSTIASLLGVLTVVNGGNAVCIRRYATSLKGSCYTDVQVAIERLGLESDFKFKKSPLEVTHKSGRIIAFRGLDDPQKIKSLKAPKGDFKFLWFEEAQEIEGYKKCRSVIQTIARGENNHCNVIFSFNPPPSALAWVNSDLVTPKKSRLILHTTYLDVPYAWLGSQFYDIANDLKESNYDAYRNEYLGEAAGSKGMIFSNVRPYKESLDFEFDVASVVRGNDFGFASDPNCYVSWYYDKKQSIAILKYAKFSYGTHIDDIVADIKYENIHNFTVFCDSAEPRSISDMLRKGLSGARAVKKGPDSIRHGIKFLQSLKAIYIDTKLYGDVYKEFSEYEYKRDRNGEYTNELPDVNNHSIDATRYAFSEIIRLIK